MYNALLQPPELICIYRIYCSEKQKSFCYSRGMRIIYFHPLCILFFFSSPGWYDFTHRIRCTFPMVYRQLNCVACITFEWHCHACMEFAGWSFVIHCWSWKYCFSVLEIEKKNLCLFIRILLTVDWLHDTGLFRLGKFNIRDIWTPELFIFRWNSQSNGSIMCDGQLTRQKLWKCFSCSINIANC